MTELLTTAEAALRLGVHPSRIRHMVRDGLLPARRFGRNLAIPASAVDALAGVERKSGRPPGSRTSSRRR